MIELLTAIPDAAVLLALEPEELGAKMLFLIRDRRDKGQFNIANLRGEIWNHRNYGPEPYPSNLKTPLLEVMNMMALKGSDAAATGAALRRPTARGRIAVAAHNSVAASHERRRMKLAAGLALGQHQAASVT
jgi:hypothetical protein